MSEIMTQERIAELDYRESNGGKIRVWLLWDRAFDRILIKLEDDNAMTWETFGVPKDKALDAFDHPYTYLYSDHAQGTVVH